MKGGDYLVLGGNLAFDVDEIRNGVLGLWIPPYIATDEVKMERYGLQNGSDRETIS